MKEIPTPAEEWTLVTTRVHGQEIPLRVAVKDEMYYYAVDEAPSGGIHHGTPDSVAVQVHRWLDSVLVDPKNKESLVPVGDWSILERSLAHRGEYVGRVQEAAVPIWDPAKEGYAFAKHPDDEVRKENNRMARLEHQGVPVDYATDPLTPEPDRVPGPIVVDFEGGKHAVALGDGAKPIVEDAPVEMLVLSPDGRLLVHNNKIDTADPERQARYEKWKAWEDHVRRLVLKLDKVTDPLFTPTKGKPGEGP
jgi:hypothetical protein